MQVAGTVYTATVYTAGGGGAAGLAAAAWRVAPQLPDAQQVELASGKELCLYKDTRNSWQATKQRRSAAGMHVYISASISVHLSM